MVTQEAENVSREQPTSNWVIDLGWYEENDRSFIDLARRSLCPKCVDKLQKKKKKPVNEDIMTAIKDCCSRSPAFITAKLPVMESAFRVLLANSNQPMDTVELSRELKLHRGGEAFGVPPEVLERLLSSDRWYGIKKVVEE